MYAITMLFLPRYLAETRGFNKPLAGALTTVMLLTMAGTLRCMADVRRPHRLWIVRLCPFLAAGGVLVVGLAGSAAAIALGAGLVGVVAATAYAHNLYYSLEEPGGGARNPGIPKPSWPGVHAATGVGRSGPRWYLSSREYLLGGSDTGGFDRYRAKHRAGSHQGLIESYRKVMSLVA